ncbi:MAG: SAM-dependent methyltransferase [Phycicoccus sp.]
MAAAGSGPGISTGRGQDLQQRIDTTVPNEARRYDYWLGGRDNYAVDRASGDAIAEVFPTIRTAVGENRRFLRRVVTFLAREAGIRQFLDVGSGLPTNQNVHQVAQDIDPTARVVYVDNDPMVLVHARALLTSSPEGATAYVDADLRHPHQLLGDPDLTQTLDLSKPVGLLLFSVLHFIPDDGEAGRVLAEFAGALAPGSYVALSVTTGDFMPPEVLAASRQIASKDTVSITFRSGTETTRLLDGLELVPPGLQPTVEWRADDEPPPRPTPAEVAMYGVVARVP